MSDLGRLRAVLIRRQRAERRLAFQLSEAKSPFPLGGYTITRSDERRIIRLDRELAERRAEIAQLLAALATEEARLLDPDAMLRFT